MDLSKDLANAGDEEVIEDTPVEPEEEVAQPSEESIQSENPEALNVNQEPVKQNSSSGNHKNKQSLFLNIAIGVVVAIIVIGGLFFFLTRDSEPELSNLPATIVEEEVQEPVLDEEAEVPVWETYINEEYGFELEYPADWQISDVNPHGTFESVFTFSGDEGILVILPQGLETPPFERLGRGQISDAQLTNENEGVVEYLTEDNVVLGYMVGFNIVPDSWESYGSIQTQAEIENVQVVESEGLDILVTGNVNQDGAGIIERMLASFKFSE